MKLRNKRLLSILPGLFIILFLSAINHAGNWSSDPGGVESKQVALVGKPLQITWQTRQSLNSNCPSGPEVLLPWSNNARFLQAQVKHNAFIPMAAYRTVLHDPLPGEENNVHLAARMLCGAVVKPGQVFSQNNALGPYSSERGFQPGPVYIGSKISRTIGGGVCKISSTLYNVAVLADLPIIERHPHGMPVPYVPYGQDATVSMGIKDLRFKNNTSHPILIWAEAIENTLYIGFYGSSKPPRVTWQHEFLNSIPAPIIYRYNPLLNKASQKTILEGMEGAAVRSTVLVEHPDGRTEIKSRGISYYNPIPAIVERNPL